VKEFFETSQRVRRMNSAIIVNGAVALLADVIHFAANGRRDILLKTAVADKRIERIVVGAFETAVVIKKSMNS
jgi:hypothetical protein